MVVIKKKQKTIYLIMKKINYKCLDILNSNNDKNVIVGDITDKKLDLNLKFDFIYSCDTFEHILNPWDATQNILKLLDEDAFFLCIVPFSWRYHACCYDTYRYSHTGIRYLFERLGNLEHLHSGYSKYGNTNGWYKDKTDKTLNGKPYSECIETIYISRKKENYKFDLNKLDKGFNR